MNGRCMAVWFGWPCEQSDIHMDLFCSCATYDSKNEHGSHHQDYNYFFHLNSNMN